MGSRLEEVMTGRWRGLQGFPAGCERCGPIFFVATTPSHASERHATAPLSASGHTVGRDVTALVATRRRHTQCGGGMTRRRGRRVATAARKPALRPPTRRERGSRRACGGYVHSAGARSQHIRIWARGAPRALAQQTDQSPAAAARSARVGDGARETTWPRAPPGCRHGTADGGGLWGTRDRSGLKRPVSGRPRRRGCKTCRLLAECATCVWSAPRRPSGCRRWSMNGPAGRHRPRRGRRGWTRFFFFSSLALVLP